MHRTRRMFAVGLATAALVGALATAGAAAVPAVAGAAQNGTSTPGSRAWNSTHVVAGWAWNGPNAPGGKAWNTTHVVAGSMEWDSFPPTANVTALEYG